MDDEKIINFGELKNKVRETDIDNLEKYIYDLYFDFANGKVDMSSFVYKMYDYMNKNNISPDKFTQIQKKLLERHGIGEEQLKKEFAYYSNHPDELKGFNLSSQDIERMAFDILGKDNSEKAKEEKSSKEENISSEPPKDNVMNFSKAKSKTQEEDKDDDKVVFSFEDLDYKKVQSSSFYNKYSEELKYDSVIKYYLKNDVNDIEIILDKERVNLISKKAINLVDMDLNEFLVSYKQMLDMKLKIVISENCNTYEY